MIIQVTVSEGFKHPSVFGDQFQIDVDPNSNIENLKILITVQFEGLDTQCFDLQCMTEYKILTTELVHQIQKVENKSHVRIIKPGFVEIPTQRRFRWCRENCQLI